MLSFSSSHSRNMELRWFPNSYEYVSVLKSKYTWWQTQYYEMLWSSLYGFVLKNPAPATQNLFEILLKPWDLFHTECIWYSSVLIKECDASPKGNHVQLNCFLEELLFWWVFVKCIMVAHSIILQLRRYSTNFPETKVSLHQGKNLISETTFTMAKSFPVTLMTASWRKNWTKQCKHSFVPSVKECSPCYNIPHCCSGTHHILPRHILLVDNKRYLANMNVLSQTAQGKWLICEFLR